VHGFDIMDFPDFSKILHETSDDFLSELLHGIVNY